MFWHVGKRILTHNLQNKRADYGKQIVVTVSRELVAKFGKNYEEKNLRRMIQFAEKYPDVENVVTLSRHLSWSHFLILIQLVCKTSLLQGLDIRTNLLIFDILFDNIKRCTPAGCDKITWRP